MRNSIYNVNQLCSGVTRGKMLKGEIYVVYIKLHIARHVWNTVLLYNRQLPDYTVKVLLQTCVKVHIVC